MKAQAIPYKKLQTTILEQFGMLLDFPNRGYYHIIKFPKSEKTLLTWSTQKIKANLEIVSTGRLILQKIGDTTQLLPSAMNLFIQMDTVSIIPLNSVKLIQVLTKGKQVTINMLRKYNEHFVVITFNSLPIAYGQVIDKTFIPICDVGVYLRNVENE